jgi:hypothetical protein
VSVYSKSEGLTRRIHHFAYLPNNSATSTIYVFIGLIINSYFFQRRPIEFTDGIAIFQASYHDDKSEITIDDGTI